MAKKCSSCGIELQSKDETKDGFIPENVLKRKEDIICKRCFKIRHYGEYIPVNITNDEYFTEVSKVIKNVDVVLFVIDIIDFESSLDERIIKLIKKKKIIPVINKIDLIPQQKHPSEVSNWVKERLESLNLNILDIAILSAKKRYGVSGILKKVKHFFQDKAKVLVMGVSNVGKSSIINQLFLKSTNLNVSKYPGTTLKIVENKIPKTDIKIIDTPGIIPNGRISDLVCQTCNLDLVPSGEISRMTFKPTENQVLLLGGLAKLRILNKEEKKPIFSFFASRSLKFHLTNKEKEEEILERHLGKMLNIPCDKCKDKYFELDFEKKVFEVKEGEELVIKGLGWLTVKRGNLKIEIELPKNVDIVIRKAFIVPRRMVEEKDEE